MADGSPCPQCGAVLAAAAPPGLCPRCLLQLGLEGWIADSEWNLAAALPALYEVKGQLGEGGMGKVYQVHHRGWHVDLAVKTPKPEIFSHAGGEEAFMREAETWVNLDPHPHIVSCYYVRTLDGIPCVFAEYVDGGSLAHWIHQQTLYAGGPHKALERILDVALQCAWGLHGAHEQGLVHQDVKPANVLMTHDGTAKVTDFGLAKARVLAGEVGPWAGGRSLLVSVGGMTPAYCSPEQARGEPLAHTSDIWSWAVSVLEMCVGTVTWAHGAVAHERFAALRAEDFLVPLPPAMAALLRACLAPRPEQRPDTMQTVARRLLDVYHALLGRAYYREEPTHLARRSAAVNNRAVSLIDLAQGQRAEQSLAQWVAEHPTDLLPWCNLGLLRLGQGTLAQVELARGYRVRTQAHPSRHEALEPLDAQVRLALRPAHTAAIVAVLWEDASARWITVDAGGNFARWSPDQASPEAFFRGLQGPPVTSAWQDPESGLLYVGREQGHLEVWRIQDGTLIASAQLQPAYTPPSHFISGANLPITHAVIGVRRGRGDPRLQVFLQNADVLMLDAHEFTTLDERHEAHHFFSAVAGSGGPWVVASDLHGTLRRYPAGAVDWDGRGTHWVHVTSLQPDEVELQRRLFALRKERVIRLQPDELPFGTRGESSHGVLSLAMTDDGVLLAAGAQTAGQIGLWRLDDFTARDAAQPARPRWLLDTGTRQPVRALCFVPERPLLACGLDDGQVQLWNYTTRERLRSFDCGTRPMALTADGRGQYLAVGGLDGHLCIEPLRTPALDHLPFVIVRVYGGSDVVERERALQALRTEAHTQVQQENWSTARDALHHLSAWERELGVESHERLALLGRVPGRRMALRGVHPMLNETVSLDAATTAGPLNAVDVAPCGTQAVAVGDVAFVHLDLPTRRLQTQDAEVRVTCVRYHPRHALIGVCTGYSTSRVGFLTFGSSHPKRFAGALIQAPCRPQELTGLAVFGDSPPYQAVCVNDGGELVFWQGGLTFSSVRVSAEPLLAVALSPDECWLACAGMDTRLHLWDVRAQHALAHWDGHGDTVSCLAVRPQGDGIATGGYDQAVRLWHLDQRGHAHPLVGHAARVTCLAFSPDGTWLASGDADGLWILWDWTRQHEMYRLAMPYGAVHGLAFACAGLALVAVYEASAVCAWELEWELDVSPAALTWHVENQHALQRARTPRRARRARLHAAGKRWWQFWQ